MSNTERQSYLKGLQTLSINDPEPENFDISAAFVSKKLPDLNENKRSYKCENNLE